MIGGARRPMLADVSPPAPSNRMVGREAEVARLIGALDLLGRGTAVVVDVTGEAGIGKSRLLAEARRLATGRGLTVASASAADAGAGTAEPFALAAALLERLGIDGSATTGHRALAALLAQAARTRPLVITVDDIHDGDAETVEWLTYLAHGRLRGPIALLLARRPSAGVRRLGEAMQIALAPLSAEASERLVGDAVEPGARRRILEACGGNPFYLTELARASDPDALPAAVLDALGAELGRLDDDAVAVAHAAAVAGDPFAPSLVASIGERDEQLVLAALDRLASAGLVTPADHARFAFRHPIVRRAIAEHAPPSWRTHAHRRAAAALAAAGAPLSARAEHMLLAAQPGDDRAIDLLVAAATQERSAAPASSARYLEGAIALLPRRASPERRCALAVELAGALTAQGRLPAAREALTEALDLLGDQGTPLTRARAVSLAVELDGRLGRGHAAVPVLRDARRSVAAGTPEAALLDLAGARWAWLTGAWSAIRPLALEAAVSGRGDAAVRASSLALAAIGASALDDVDDARALRFAASGTVDEITGDARPEVLTALLWVARADLRAGCYEDAERHLHRAEHFGPEADLELPLLLADLELRRGRAQRGRALAHRALESSRSRGDGGLVGWALAARCRADLAAGDIESAVAVGSELEQLLGDGPPQPPLGPGLVALAEARLAAGQAALGGDRLVAGAGGEALPWLEAHERVAGLRVLCETALARGDGPAAHRHAARAAAIARDRAFAGDHAEALGASAAVAAAEGRPADAAADARQGVVAAEEAGHPSVAGRLLLIAAEGLAAVGEGRTAAGLRDRAVALQRTLGEPLRRSDPDRLALLSDREREVAELVCKRFTNREIAEQLVLSPKTVERHLSRIFMRLGIRSRVELARLVEREGPRRSGD